MRGERKGGDGILVGVHLWKYGHLRKRKVVLVSVGGRRSEQSLAALIWGHQSHMRSHLHDVWVCPALVWLVVLRVFKQHLVHISAGVLEQLVGAVEDDQRDLTVTQHAQLICLLHQPKFPLRKCHLRKKQAGFLKKKMPLSFFFFLTELFFFSKPKCAVVRTLEH